MRPLSVLLLLLIGVLPFSLQGDEKPPNIVVILSDDAGFEEFGIYGVKKGVPSNTPNIDRLGEQGVAFKNAWTQSICGPSRSMFLTGNYAVRNGAYDNKLYYMPDGVNMRRDSDRLPHFTRVLKDAGYTVAVSGKWHNPAGWDVLQHHEQLGLDTYAVWDASPQPFEKLLGKQLIADETWEFAAISGEPKISRYWKPGIIRDGQIVPTTMQDYGPDIFAGFIMDFIEAQAHSDKPFLAYYTMVLPHGAHSPTPDLVAQGIPVTNAHSPKGTPEGKRNFLAQINYADKLLGKIVAKIGELGIADNTIIIYASDNGTTASSKSRGVEYGVHVPLVVYGAGIKKRGLTDELADFTDMLPTLAAFAGTTVPEKYHVDGTSLAPFLTGKSEKTKDVIFSFPGVATLVRTRDYMLEAVAPIYGKPYGRFYKTNGSYDGRGYENITHDPAYAKVRAEFDRYLEAHPNPLPTSWDDEAWSRDDSMKRAKKFWSDPKRKQKHLELPREYKFYDESF
jgi:arylsulfatase A-like enzyme